MMILQIMLQDLDKRVFINEQKKLASSEFSWSLGVCKLDTEIAEFTLQVKWKAITPSRSAHTNEKFEICGRCKKPRTAHLSWLLEIPQKLHQVGMDTLSEEKDKRDWQTSLM